MRLLNTFLVRIGYRNSTSDSLGPQAANKTQIAAACEVRTFFSLQFYRSYLFNYSICCLLCLTQIFSSSDNESSHLCGGTSQKPVASTWSSISAGILFLVGSGAGRIRTFTSRPALNAKLVALKILPKNMFWSLSLTGGGISGWWGSWLIWM